jgi:hypothetical protein
LEIRSQKSEIRKPEAGTQKILISGFLISDFSRERALGLRRRFAAVAPRWTADSNLVPFNHNGRDIGWRARGP